MLSANTASRVLSAGLKQGASFVEIYVERTRALVVGLKSSKIDQISDGIDFGIGIRVLFGTQSVYGYTNSSAEPELLRLVEALCALKGKDTPPKPVNFGSRLSFSLPDGIQSLSRSSELQARVDLLKKIDLATRNESALVKQANVNSIERFQEILVFNSEGLEAYDERVTSRLSAECIVEKEGVQDRGHYGPGASLGFEYLEKLDPKTIAAEISRRALISLSAAPCPAGTFPVVIDSGFGGVIFHEACGHLLETTAVEKKASVLWDKKGEMIANPVVNAVDDGTILGAWGSLNLDDEGMKTERTQLIRNGRLEHFMVDRVGHLKTGHRRTGSARRQSYRFASASRMRNTFIEPGTTPFKDLISGIEFGIYARSMGGGSVKSGTGEYNFAVQEGYLIENGKIGKPVKGATLLGNGPDTLKKISKVANNFELMAGMCGSVSGSIPASVGQPAILVDELLVGGQT